MRKLASIVRIADCVPVENTERLSVATMEGNGWKVVTERDEFKSGDVAVYFEIDSALDPNDGRYSFLKERCLRKFVSKSGNVLREVIRIKTAKLRGVVSQGLLMPLGLFPEVTDQIMAVPVGDDTEDTRDYFFTEDGTTDVVGADVTEILHVEHYDEIKAALVPDTGTSVGAEDALGQFPSEFVPKTDEIRVQNLTEYFTTMKGRRFEVTEKNDGSSVTMFYSPSIDGECPFGVCSRNLRLKPETTNGSVPTPWKMEAKYGVEARLKSLVSARNCEYAFQGELVGPGINSNRDMYPDYEWHVFKVYDITHKRYVLPAEAREMCAEMGLDYVNVIDEECDVFDRFLDVDELLTYAEGKTKRGNEREGLVFKSCDYPYVSFKAVSNRYLMKEKD